ncbi:MAG: ABC transporter permease [Dehalococcoidia bacterium]|nr:ABC transporter permease [Dehalococcoidia bacterium]
MNALKEVTPSAFRVWQRNADVYVRLWRSEAWPPFVDAFITLIAFGFGLGAYVALGTADYIIFLAPGLIAQSVLFGASFETTYGSYFRMDIQRTFEAMIATPLSIEDVITGEVMWGATRSLISATALLIIMPVFGLVQSPWAALILPAAFLAGLVFAALGMLFTSFVASINAYNYYLSLFITPNIFFGNVFFPLDRLPDALRWFAYGLPTTHVSTIFRALNEGALTPSLLWNALYLVVVGGATYLFALIQMRRRLIR